MFVIREAFPDDLDQLHEVAGHLDTVNLPNDRKVLERLVELSRKSFAGEIEPLEREYLFVLVEAELKKIIGTSMIHAQHGTRRSPHVFFELLADERYSETLDRHFIHRCLRIGYNYDGPTEIGGLILLPQYRGRPEALGKLLSYVRFLYIGMHPERFRDEVLSELLPPLEADGTSLLWESLGRQFTGLSYQDADRLSKDNKEFIRTLFPQGLIYTCLLPKPVQAIIGQVGPQTRGVEKMLRRIGFEHQDRIDPFDGGPHFGAATRDVTLVRETRRARVAADGSVDQGVSDPSPGGAGRASPESRPWGMVAAEHGRAPHFVAVGARFRAGDGVIGLNDAARAALGVQLGDDVAYVTT